MKLYHALAYKGTTFRTLAVHWHRGSKTVTVERNWGTFKHANYDVARAIEMYGPEEVARLGNRDKFDHDISGQESNKILESWHTIVKREKLTLIVLTGKRPE